MARLWLGSSDTMKEIFITKSPKRYNNCRNFLLFPTPGTLLSGILPACLPTLISSSFSFAFSLGSSAGSAAAGQRGFPKRDYTSSPERFVKNRKSPLNGEITGQEKKRYRHVCC